MYMYVYIRICICIYLYIFPAHIHVYVYVYFSASIGLFFHGGLRIESLLKVDIGYPKEMRVKTFLLLFLLLLSFCPASLKSDFLRRAASPVVADRECGWEGLDWWSSAS